MTEEEEPRKPVSAGDKIDFLYWTQRAEPRTYYTIRDGKRYDFHTLRIRAGTHLFKGGTELWRYLNGGGSFPFNRGSHLTWFGSRQTAEIYGPATDYVLKNDISVINMGVPQSIETLKIIAKSQRRDNVIEALDETFPIEEKKEGNTRIQQVYRRSEAREDKIVANFLCSVFDCNTSSIQGWGHLALPEFGDKMFQPEVMLCCPYRTLDNNEFRAVPYPTDKLNSLIQEDKPYQRKMTEKNRAPPPPPAREPPRGRRLAFG